MALPGAELSSEIIEGPFIGPRSRSVGYLRDFEHGGIALSDPTKGLQYQSWEASCDGSVVTLAAENGAGGEIYQGQDISEISFTFDQNMRPMLAFVEGGVAKYQWYDTQAESQVVSVLGPDVITPRVALDDKRELQSGTSDIILAYIVNGELYYRQQRDRYEVPRFLTDGVAELVRVGMNNRLRFQFELRKVADRGGY